MRAIQSLLTALLLLGAVPSWATLTDPPPANPCPAGAKFATNLSILDVSGDGGLPPPCNGPNVETAITCTVKEKFGAFVDVAIEYFDMSGALISPPVPVTICGLPEGTTVKFSTAPLPSPYAAGVIVPTAAPVPGIFCAPFTPGCFLHGSARILATSKQIQCTATRIDFAGPCFGGPPMPLSTKDLTILNRGRYIGD
jgi:hypothetical protein